MVIGRDGGSGTLTQNGGTLDYNPSNGFLFIGASNDAATTAVYNMNGGTLNMHGKILSVPFGNGAGAAWHVERRRHCR